MDYRRDISLSVRTYDVHYRKAKHIPQEDLLSRCAFSNVVSSEDCSPMQPLSVNRLDLILETRRYHYAILSCVRDGWKVDVR